MTANKTLIYKKVPTGLPVPGEHLTVEDRPIDLEQAAPEGGLVVEIIYASFDPYLRGKMRDPTIKSYSPAFELDGPIVSGSVSKVIKTDSPDFKEDDLIVAYIPVAEYARISKEALATVQKINNPHNLELGLFLGPLGMPGLTAWSGLHRIGQPQKGETIFISSAAGAVGQVVGQIAKREGLTVIGSVGSDEKLEYIIKELGFDAGFNYKKESPKDALPRLAPEGIDIYFENVGGDHLEAALANFKVGGRMPVCGMIDIYNTPYAQQKGTKNLTQLIAKQITMQGFLVGNPKFGPAYYKEHQENMQKWLVEGSVKAKLHVTEGIDNAAEGFVDLLVGRNFGKAILKIRYNRVGYNINGSTTGRYTGDYADIPYLGGNTAGPAVSEVWKADDLTWNQTFIAANESNWAALAADGFMGLAFSSIIDGGANTVVETLMAEGHLDAAKFGIYYGPEANDTNGQPGEGVLTIGASRESKYVEGDLTTIPITRVDGTYDVWRSTILGIGGTRTVNGTAVRTTTDFDFGRVVFDTGAGSVSFPDEQNLKVYESIGMNYTAILAGEHIPLCSEFNSSWSVSFNLGDYRDPQVVTLRGDQLRRPGFAYRDDACWPPFEGGNAAGFTLIGTPFLRNLYTVWDYGVDATETDISRFNPQLSFGALKSKLN
ncbi:hypothetical protein G7Z17_g957 [Cylindrodendrum hubeiense]|uniref:Dehydrogenase FUB6 n=1 Tax=Cylindrodendrum hubeiense TaxID=595255 RepID=A0A9P5LKN2_9HYPO|nr:hypothetical protein G7Z17_g957 [Cylindrodendrum hubeiense]